MAPPRCASLKKKKKFFFAQRRSIDWRSFTGPYQSRTKIWSSRSLDLRSHAWKVRRVFFGLHVNFVLIPFSTLTSSTGVKTRNFGTIISELTSCFSIHAANNSTLNGISLEFTGELNDEGFSVTECLGGSMELAEEQLGLRYQSFCDPRLNFEQSRCVAAFFKFTTTHD